MTSPTQTSATTGQVECPVLPRPRREDRREVLDGGRHRERQLEHAPESKKAQRFDTSEYRDDVHKFGEFVRHGGTWQYAAIVARWVDSGVGNGRPATNRQQVASSRKVSVRQFATDAAVSRPTISKYLKAWHLASGDGHVPPADAITAGEVVDLDWENLPSWSDYYREATSRDTTTDAQSGGEPMPPLPGTARRKLMHRLRSVSSVIQFDPDVVAKIVDGDDDYDYIKSTVMLLSDWVQRVESTRKQ